MSVLQRQSAARFAHEAPDIETSSDEYATRFGGSVGKFFLDEQANVVVDLLRDCGGKQVLDVGGGHAQLARPLTRRDYDVTVLGSAPSCRRQLDKSMSKDEYSFEIGSLLDLPFPDEAFDLVVAFRLLAHVNDWPLLIRELCRVSRGSILIDYPERRSVNAVGQLLFPLKQAVERNTRRYSCFGQHEIQACFRRFGFRIVTVRRQFLFPMALHRGLNCAPFSRCCERLASQMGATRRWGSPAIALAQRCGE